MRMNEPPHSSFGVSNIGLNTDVNMARLCAGQPEADSRAWHADSSDATLQCESAWHRDVSSLD
eukprot:1411065-Pyramimonas_sp.AAC.1